MSEGFHVCNRSRGHCPILVMSPEPSGSDVVMDASLAFENTSATNAINSMDALQALRIAVGLDASNGLATYEDYIAADIYGSGSVNSMDALNILKYAVGLDAPDPHWVFINSGGAYADIA
jgi:hypothetical protein